MRSRFRTTAIARSVYVTSSFPLRRMSSNPCSRLFVSAVVMALAATAASLTAQPAGPGSAEIQAPANAPGPAVIAPPASVPASTALPGPQPATEEIVGPIQMRGETLEAVLFQLGNQLTRGIPFETTLRNVTPQIRNLRISKFFDRVLYNIETFGMTLEQAVFDETQGAIHDYPSKLIKAIMHAVVEISKRGMICSRTIRRKPAKSRRDT